MAGALARRDEAAGVHSAQEAALRLLLEEARLLALNAAIESAAAPGSELADARAAVDLLLQQIRSAASLDRPL